MHAPGLGSDRFDGLGMVFYRIVSYPSGKERAPRKTGFRETVNAVR